MKRKNILYSKLSFAERLKLINNEKDNFYFAFDPNKSNESKYIIYVGRNSVVDLSTEKVSDAQFLIRPNDEKAGEIIRSDKSITLYVNEKTFNKFLAECKDIYNSYKGAPLPDAWFSKLSMIKFMTIKIIKEPLFKKWEKWSKGIQPQMKLVLYGPYVMS